jgi:hypothetical protein
MGHQVQGTWLTIHLPFLMLLKQLCIYLTIMPHPKQAVISGANLSSASSSHLPNFSSSEMCILPTRKKQMFVNAYQIGAKVRDTPTTQEDSLVERVRSRLRMPRSFMRRWEALSAWQT